MNTPATVCLRLALRSTYCKCRLQERLLSRARHCLAVTRSYSAEALAKPAVEYDEKTFLPKIQKIVDDISNLTLLEVADLNQLLKKQLKIEDAPMMAMGAMPVAAQGAPAEEEEDQAPVKMAYNVKLKGFDASKKIPLIKAIKSVIPDTNLVQAKKIVESAPVVVKNDLTKEEAETLKKALEDVGGDVEID